MLGQGAAVALPNWAYFMQEARKDKSCNKYTSGRFYFGDNLTYMPACESFIEDTMMDKLKDWFNGLSDSKKNEEETRRDEERRKEEEKRKEEERARIREKKEAAKAKREERKAKKKRFRLFGG